MNVTPLRLAFALIIAVFSYAPAAAQGTGGELQGVVVDPSGTPLPDVIITIVNTETGARREARTDDQGRFTAAALPPGRYEATAESPRFAPRRQENVLVPIAQTVAVRFELRLATSADTLTVGELQPVLDPTVSHVAALIEDAALSHAPVRSRNFIELAATTSGVARDLAAGELLFAGQAGDANAISVDGGELLGFGSYQFSQQAVREFRVDLNGYRAEYGRASGSVVHAITRSGTNAFHGTAVALRGGSFFSEPDSGTDQVGAAAGGPIARRRHFFFVNYDVLRRAVPDRDQRVFLARTDHQLTSDHHVMLRYNQQDLSDIRTTRSSVASVTSVLGARVVNDGRLHYAQARNLGSVNRLQVADTVTWSGSGHELKTGFDAVGDDLSATVPFSTLTTTAFSSDNISVFLQDEWQARPALTVNLGARHDTGTFGDWDPRVGLAWQRAGRLVVRGSYGRFSSALTELRVRQANAGIEWEWMPKTTMGVSYLEGRTEGWDYRAVAADLQRRFWQGSQFRAAYTLSDTPSRHRTVVSFVHGTDGIADRFPDALGGVVHTVLKDWTVSAIFAMQSMDPRLHTTRIGYMSLDPRLARTVRLGAGTTLAFLLESYNLRNRPNVLAVNDALFPRQVGQPDGRLTQVGVRLRF